jgi:translation initiation factor IF-2
MPVEIIGLEGVPNAGDPFQVTESEKYAKQISSKRQELKRFEEAKSIKKITLDNLYSTIKDGEVKELKVLIKADVQGSAEAVKASLERNSPRRKCVSSCCARRRAPSTRTTSTSLRHRTPS